MLFPRLACICALLLACGCSSVLNSSATDGTPVLTFAGPSPGSTVTLLVNSHAAQAGIKGLTLDIASASRQDVADQVTIDDIGNLGVRGHVFSTFEHAPLTKPAQNGDALAALARARFDVASSSAQTRVAFRGPQPSYIGDGNALDISSSLVLTMAAVKQLSQEVTTLRTQVRALRAEQNAR